MSQAQSLTISVSKVIKQFGRFAALRGVTAEFDAGRFHAILGDNGAGKTTLLRALAGLAQPTQGTISIFGKIREERCRDIGYMAHPSLLYDEMSGMENLRYFAAALRHRRRCAVRRGDSCGGARSGIDAWRRPVFARHAAADVAGAGDLARSARCCCSTSHSRTWTCIRRARWSDCCKGMRDAGKTIFVVTHQALLLEGVADEFVWMQAGQIVDRTASACVRESWSSEARNDLALGGDAGDAGKRHSPRMALERRAELHAVLLAAGRGDFRFFFRSAGGRIAAHRRRAGVGGVSLRGRGRAESDLGARTAQPGAGCLSRLSGSGERVVSREGSREISFSSACWKR